MDHKIISEKRRFGTIIHRKTCSRFIEEFNWNGRIENFQQILYVQTKDPARKTHLRSSVGRRSY